MFQISRKRSFSIQAADTRHEICPKLLSPSAGLQTTWTLSCFEELRGKTTEYKTIWMLKSCFPSEAGGKKGAAWKRNIKTVDFPQSREAERMEWKPDLTHFTSSFSSCFTLSEVI